MKSRAEIGRNPASGDSLIFKGAGELVVHDVFQLEQGQLIIGTIGGKRYWWTGKEWEDWFFPEPTDERPAAGRADV